MVDGDRLGEPSGFQTLAVIMYADVRSSMIDPWKVAARTDIGILKETDEGSR